MSRTQGRFDCDTGYEDGVIDLSPFNFQPFGATLPTATRALKGNIYLAQGSSLTNQYSCPLSTLLFRTGLQDYSFNRFGAGDPGNDPYGATGIRFGTPTTQSTANAVAAGVGVPVNIAVKHSALFTVGRDVFIDPVSVNSEVQVITAIPDPTHITVAQLAFNHTSVFIVTQGAFTTPWGVSGNPPFTGVTQFTPPSSRPKGLLIRGMEVRYVVGTLALTSITIGLSQTLFKEATALAVTDILVPAALATAISTTMTVFPVALASPIYLTNDLFEYILELIAVTPATSTFNFYGVTLYVTYNYN